MNLLLPQIREIEFDIRKISDFAATKPDCLRADIGEPNLPSPPEIASITRELLKTETFAYAPTFGIPELIESVSEFERRKMEYFAEPRVCITAGAQSALFAVMSAVLAPGSSVLVHQAYYPPYKTIATILGAQLIEVDFADADAVARALDDRVKLAIINSPGNPTGTVFSAAELGRLADVFRGRDLLCLADDVYDRIFFGDTPAHIAQYLPEQTIVVNSVSKSLSLTGLRVGWMLGPAALITQAAKVHRCIISCPNTLAQRTVAHFLPRSADFLARQLQEYQERALAMRAVFNSLGWQCAKPQGAIYLFPEIMGQTDSETAVFRMIEESGVSAIPGKFFGSSNENRLRFCFGATSKEDIEKLGRRLTEARK